MRPCPLRPSTAFTLCPILMVAVIVTRLIIFRLRRHTTRGFAKSVDPEVAVWTHENASQLARPRHFPNQHPIGEIASGSASPTPV